MVKAKTSRACAGSLVASTTKVADQARHGHVHLQDGQGSARTGSRTVAKGHHRAGVVHGAALHRAIVGAVPTLGQEALDLGKVFGLVGGVASQEHDHVFGVDGDTVDLRRVCATGRTSRALRCACVGLLG